MAIEKKIPVLLRYFLLETNSLVVFEIYYNETGRENILYRVQRLQKHFFT